MYIYIPTIYGIYVYAIEMYIEIHTTRVLCMYLYYTLGSLNESSRC